MREIPREAVEAAAERLAETFDYVAPRLASVEASLRAALPYLIRDSWIAGYAAALEFCADDESRMFWPWNSNPRQAATEAWEEREASSRSRDVDVTPEYEGS